MQFLVFFDSYPLAWLSLCLCVTTFLARHRLRPALEAFERALAPLKAPTAFAFLSKRSGVGVDRLSKLCAHLQSPA